MVEPSLFAAANFLLVLTIFISIDKRRNNCYRVEEIRIRVYLYYVLTRWSDYPLLSGSLYTGTVYMFNMNMI